MKKWMNRESDLLHRVVSRFIIKAVDFAVFTILMDADQDFTLRVNHLPARSLGIEISRAFFVNIFRAVHNLPARVFVLPKVCHFFPLISLVNLLLFCPIE